MNRRTAITLLCATSLTGCAAMSADLTTATSAVSKVVATVTTDLTTASNLYGIAKGIGQVALAALSVADPAAAAVVTAGIALVDPLIAKAAAGASLAASDVSTILTQSQAILVAAAPAITAVAHSV